MKPGFMRMSIFKRRFIVCAFALITIVTACVKNKTTPVLTPTTSTITQIVEGGSNLTILDSAMSKAGLLLTFDSSTNYTLFAPTDVAFKNAGIYDSTISKYSVADLKRLIMYHTIANIGKTLAVLKTEVTTNTPIPSGSPNDTLFLTIDSTGFLYVNGNLVTQADVIAKNGVIHVLSGVLVPPVGNIDSTLNLLIQSDTTLTYFVAALNRTKGRSTDLVSLLSTGVYTVFAPNNAAFRLTADSTLDIIQNSADPDSLARLLQTHIIAGRVFSSDFPADSVRFSIAAPTITWPKGDSLFFTSTIGNTIQSKGDTTQTGFLRTNILATNGVIHKINQVLFPYYPF